MASTSGSRVSATVRRARLAHGFDERTSIEDLRSCTKMMATFIADWRGRRPKGSRLMYEDDRDLHRRLVRPAPEGVRVQHLKAKDMPRHASVKPIITDYPPRLELRSDLGRGPPLRETPSWFWKLDISPARMLLTRL